MLRSGFTEAILLCHVNLLEDLCGERFCIWPNGDHRRAELEDEEKIHPILHLKDSFVPVSSPWEHWTASSHVTPSNTESYSSRSSKCSNSSAICTGAEVTAGEVTLSFFCLRKEECYIPPKLPSLELTTRVGTAAPAPDCNEENGKQNCSEDMESGEAAAKSATSQWLNNGFGYQHVQQNACLALHAGKFTR
ncbi:Hypothetical predicted protein [Podarcis lilfordi]|uniref:Uncharacterized protein n=1 Tax=Podarcis lilfordi TaxID=74358 RepID=A0AA35K432_9SAUR|nr:Hypothetical predicted protein [Podarcis lilfordi]